MSDFLGTVKADLLDRRMLPLVALVALALVGAIAYVVLGGGASTGTQVAAVSRAPVTGSSGVSITQAEPEKAVAEMTGGIAEQHHGTAHDPFSPLPEAKAKAATSSSSTTTVSSSSGSTGPTTGTGSPSSGAGSSPSSSGGSSPTTPSTPSKPAKPAKPKTVYHVAALFGELPAGATPQTAQLTPYENLKLLSPLPSTTQPLIVFRGVTLGGKSATFTLVSEAILHGPAACLPSTTQCEAIDLRSGQTEQLEYVSPLGQPLTYELRIVSIVSSQASSAAFKNVLRGESKAGRELLDHAGLDAIPDLHYSSQVGVLVFAAHPRHGR